MRGSLPFLGSAVILAALLAASSWPGRAATPPGPPPAPAAAPKPSSPSPIDVNRASAEELTAIPGIGKALAERIVEFREKNGPFTTVDDLLKVRGIGEKSLKKIAPHVTAGRAR